MIACICQRHLSSLPPLCFPPLDRLPYNVRVWSKRFIQIGRVSGRGVSHYTAPSTHFTHRRTEAILFPLPRDSRWIFRHCTRIIDETLYDVEIGPAAARYGAGEVVVLKAHACTIGQVGKVIVSGGVFARCVLDIERGDPGASMAFFVGFVGFRVGHGSEAQGQEEEWLDDHLENLDV